MRHINRPSTLSHSPMRAYTDTRNTQNTFAFLTPKKKEWLANSLCWCICRYISETQKCVCVCSCVFYCFILLFFYLYCWLHKILQRAFYSFYTKTLRFACPVLLSVLVAILRVCMCMYVCAHVCVMYVCMYTYSMCVLVSETCQNGQRTCVMAP